MSQDIFKIMPSFYEKIHAQLTKLKPLSSYEVAVQDTEIFALTLFRIIQQEKRGVVAVVENSSIVDEVISDLQFFLEISGSKSEILEFPEYQSGKGLFQPDNESIRNAVLGKLNSQGNDFTVLTTASAFSGPVSDPESFIKAAVEFKVGDLTDGPEQLAKLLVDMGYDNEFQVNIPGEFARRGGILDVYSPMYSEPFRIEFFGDEIDSIRTFDPATQRSIEEVDSFKAVPRSGQSEETGCLMNYCPNYPIVLVDSKTVKDHVERYFGEEGMAVFAENCETSQAVFTIDHEPGEDSSEVSALASLYKSSLPETESSVSILHRQFVLEQLEQWTATGCEVLVCCGSKGNLDRFRQLLDENPQIKRKNVLADESSLSAGFFISKTRTVVLSENEIFGRTVQVSRKKSSRQQALDSLLEAEPELAAGDYAVHVSHGICRYDGIEIQDNQGVLCEVMVLEFAEERKLYVPLESAHLVSRYIGGRRGMPKLSRLGGSSWGKAREKAEGAANDLAADLLRIQAVREHSRGHVAAPDNDWQQMFENAFPYKETEDQMKAIEAVKLDMESPKPMDRLICGDVGFGKTEVALRAAFKAVMDGRQVGIIVPTTVLAQQHYRTFTQRMADYPVDIRLMCRFVSGKDQKAVLEDMAEGNCDIVIGTHRLLQKDIKFGRLGLLVIDEEQRFGVEDKEQLKKMRATVDILTMTATPIPRTLYFSLAGLKDLSTIMTPPVERKPVKTIVSKDDDEVIKQAILRELERGGQVYFLHNRVQTIEKRAFHIQQLVPEAKVIFGHGQMKDRDLEDVMSRMVEHKCDVFVSTTIIESGLDNPRANTIIIDRADRFGLAELYQLRGRVGRYHLQAYCYLMLPQDGLLVNAARQRLSAIRRYTHLGAGFKLALRDLEIRGTGNLLGKEQSGHIAAVGFDMYCRLLKKSVSRLKKIDSVEKTETHVNLDFLPVGMSKDRSSACIPVEYVDNEDMRLETYKRLSSVQNVESFNDLRKELADRFGAFPDEFKYYLELIEIRIIASVSKIYSVTTREERLFLENEDGFLKLNGKIPRLTASTTLSKLSEVKKIIRQFKGR